LLKAFYSRAGADELLWILAPSAWLARFAGGIDLVYEPGAGFISHTHHLVVGTACAGVNFLIISFLCVYFSFARHFPGGRTRWLAASLLISFIATIIANGLRIFVSAHLWDADIYGSWITREAMHRVAGTAIYYASLLGLYFAINARLGGRAPTATPLFWYAAISLGVPLAGRLVAEGEPGFSAHAAWVLAVALFLTIAVKALPSVLRNRLHWRP
jgi:exosortase K